MSLPRYINSRSIAAWLGPTWRPQRIQRIFRQMGIAHKVGRYICVKPEELAGAWPEVYELMLEKISVIPEVDHALAGKPRVSVKKPANKQTVVRSECEHVWDDDDICIHCGINGRA